MTETLLTLRPLSAAEFRARKAELEARDGVIVPPELLAAARRAQRLWKLRRHAVDRLGWRKGKRERK